MWQRDNPKVWVDKEWLANVASVRREVSKLTATMLR
jgi:hypothetical protein